MPDDDGAASGERLDPPMSRDAVTAVVFAALLAITLAFDALYLGKGKHAICDRWLAKGQADCAGSDGFRQWAPFVVRHGLILFAIELVLLPLVAYLIGRAARSSYARRTTAANP
ncbi:MAG: hypothetical protein QOF57_2482 [Frankiaceae bacterium]|jgi:hypothetical protein|nr:hypothetical protein [Frankiaceae bacterium]MDQ1727009.1 hypothetical protein [Frankiaceae bacterium]